MILKELKEKVQHWLVNLYLEDKKNWDSEEQFNSFGSDFSAKYNEKYIKIIKHTNHNEKNCYVFAFVDYEGNIYKPAGWNAPAKGVRATIDNPPLTERDLYKKYC